MNTVKFVEAIRIAVLETSILAVKSNLEDPPGRQPAQELVQLSNWYNNLNNENKQMVLRTISESVRTSVFIFCSLIDGVMAMEGLEEKGKLKLYYEKDGQLTLLNSPNEPYLHDLL